MDLKSFTHRGVDYEVESVTKISEKLYQIHTKDNKILVMQFNQAIFKWIITETEEAK